MTGIVGLDHVQIAAPPGCEDAARAFYGGLLGLLEIDKPPLLAVRGAPNELEKSFPETGEAGRRTAW